MSGGDIEALGLELEFEFAVEIELDPPYEAPAAEVGVEEEEEEDLRCTTYPTRFGSVMIHLRSGFSTRIEKEKN